MSGRLVLLATTPRVAPGLLSWPAWDVLRGAAAVLTSDAEHPLRPELEAAGVHVEVVPGGTAYADVAERLLNRAASSTVVWLLGPGEDPGLAEAVTLRAPGHDVAVETIVGSSDLAGAHVLDLVAVMDRLRSPGGCPWDARQTHVSLVEYLVEETYETVEAIESGDDVALREELGDLLLQVAFHARIAQERDEPWSIDDVADGITAKLVSRHPHVFADGDARTAEQVEAGWALLKAAEKGRESVTDGIPAALPALVLAAKALRRSSGVLGVEWIAPEVLEAADAAYDAVDGDVGELLLALVQRLADAGVDAEQALREAVRGHRSRVRAAEGIDDSGREP